MSGTRHLSTNRGKRVRLLMRDGKRVDGHFVKREDRWLWLEPIGGGEYMQVRCAKIRAMVVNPREGA